MKNKTGFTLLEMVLVMTIIAILFLLTVPNLSKVISTASAKGCDAQTKVVDAALVQYLLDNDVTSASIDQLVSQGYLTAQQTTCQNGQSISIIDGHAQAY